MHIGINNREAMGVRQMKEMFMVRLMAIVVSLLFIHHSCAAQGDFDRIRSLIPSNLDSASVEVRAYHKLAVELGVDSLLGKSNYLRALIAFYNGKYPLSESFNKAALEYIPQKAENSDMLSKVWNNLGILYGIKGMYGLAQDALQRSGDYALLLGDTLGSLYVLINLGLLEDKKGNYESARMYFRNVKQSFDEYIDQDPDFFGLYFVNMATTFVNEEIHWDSAQYYTNKAIEEFESKDILLGLFTSMINNVMVQIGLGRYGDANRVLNQLDSLVRERELSQNEEAQVLLHRGLLSNKTGHYSEALGFLQQALQFYIDQSYSKGVEKTYRLMLFSLAGLGEIEEYIQLEKKFKEDLEKIQITNSSISYVEVQEFYNDKRVEDELVKQRQKVSWLDKELEKAVLGLGVKNKVILLLLISSVFLLVVTLFIRAKSKELNLLRQLDSFKIWLNGGVQPSGKEGGEENPKNGGIDYSPEKPELSNLYKDLIRLLEDNDMYKEPNLSLASVARLLNTNVGYLSKVVNSEGGANFNKLVNKYRVHETIRMIENEGPDRLNLKGIAFRVGFNSYRNFYRVFKEETGLTPKEYVNFLEAGDLLEGVSGSQ
jgi:AraC-like DNA-binding protein